jgi:hypothetical protein
MNWTRIGLGGVAAGIVTWISDFVLHGMVMGPTYQRLSQVYSQTQANPAVWRCSRDLLHRRAPSARPRDGRRGGRAASPSGCSSVW